MSLPDVGLVGWVGGCYNSINYERVDVWVCGCVDAWMCGYVDDYTEVLYV